ncbi:MAG: hypothetical protein ABI674_04715 [Spartobacteria bacterium]
METTTLYRRLGSAHQFGVATGGWNTLYLAPDHLLLRTTSSFVESYRRFYFSDIEAITICKTVRFSVWNGVWGTALFFSILALIFKPGWAGTICTNIFFALLLVNIARGPTSVTFLQTRVQRRALPLRRVKRALKVVNLLSEKIVAAQAEIDFSATAPVVRQTAPPPLETAPATSFPPPLPGESAGGGVSLLHLATFVMLVLSGAVALWEGLQHRPVLIYATVTALVLNIGLAVACLVQQRRRRVVARVRPVAWVSIAGHALGVPLVYMGFAMAYMMREVNYARATGKTQPAQIGVAALRAMPGFHYVLLVYGAFCVILGLLGCVLLLSRARKPSTS